MPFTTVEQIVEQDIDGEEITRNPPPINPDDQENKLTPETDLADEDITQRTESKVQ